MIEVKKITKEVRSITFAFLLIAISAIVLLLFVFCYKGLEASKFLIIVLFLFVLIAYFTIQKISNYIRENEHLKSLLSVVREINQLIVREKNREKLIQKSCDILASKEIFGRAWIALTPKNKQIENIASTDNKDKFTQFKEKIKSGWTPYCVEKTAQQNNFYSLIEDTVQHCVECPLKDIYDGKSALNLELKYNENIFGYLTLSIDEKNVKCTQELGLLKEVTGDIAYALNSIERENSINYLEELYENIINSVQNMIFVKDTDFVYIACNKAFEAFMGKSKDEIIGKSDYEIFDKEEAELFRKNDEIMLLEKVSKSNYEWVTYPDGEKAYMLTVKSPLFNSEGEVIGLVGNSADLTEQNEAEESLFESEKRFKQLMKESPSVIEVYDLDGLQIEVNHAYELLWGFDAGLTLKKFNLLKSEEVKRTGLIEYIKRAYAGESVTVPLYEYNPTGETEAQGNGRVRILKTRIYPLKDYLGKVKNIVIMHEDVTERENSLLQLQQKKKELETIIQEAPNPIMIHDEDGKVIMINRVWKELTGYSYSEIDTIDKWLKKAYGKKMPQVKEYIDKLFLMNRKVNNSGEYSITTKNGDTVIWQFSTSPLGVIDKKQVMIASAMDITELKKKDKLMMVQSRHAAMGEMIGMIAHQWRQPISIISMIANNMLLDMALGNFNSNKAENYSKDILEQTKHLSKTIDDFRNFFKQDKEVSKIRIKTIIDETYSIVKDSLINNNIEFNISNKSKSEINAYPRELMQAFVNIINNAKDALLLKEIKNAFIEVTLYEDENYVNTKICNNGGSIPEDILFKIFDPYFTTKDEKTGTGLGLYMSKMIVEEHLKGILEVSNTENGVCFIVRLPKHRGVE